MGGYCRFSNVIDVNVQVNTTSNIMINIQNRLHKIVVIGITTSISSMQFYSKLELRQIIKSIN